jgi:hypothetical protein
MKLIYDKSGSKIASPLHKQVHTAVYKGIYPGAVSTLFFSHGEVYSFHCDSVITNQPYNRVLNGFRGGAHIK